MKQIITLLTLATLLSTTLTAQVNMPAPSSTQTIKQDFGLGKIELTYSRPGLKGRQPFKENGDFVPTGKLWRTGANASTKLKFTDFVNIGGKPLDSGTYVLYTIPYKDQWEIILNKGINNAGIDGYKESEDVVRFKVPANKMKDDVETFTMQFANIKPESCELHLIWGNTAVKIPITTTIKDRLRAQIEDALKGEKKPYQQAANFYYEWDKDYVKALENVNQGIAANEKAFWLYLLKAKIQHDMGDNAGAKASANKCIEVATAAKNDEYVKMANELLKKIG